MRTVHLVITGRVQGVGYRDWTRREALRLRLSGWVRNRPDGSVEAVVRGKAEAVTAMLEACRYGPTAARIDAIHATDADSVASDDFEIRPTG